MRHTATTKAHQPPPVRTNRADNPPIKQALHPIPHTRTPTPRPPRSNPRSGAALIITLLVVSVLTVIVIGFLASMSTERLTADSHAALTQAELAAKAGVAEASALIARTVLNNPWHGLGVANLLGQPTTVLLGDEDPTQTPRNKVFLLSHDSTLSTFDKTNSTDLNIRRSPTDEIGWIGSPVDINTGTISHRPARAHWIEILQDPTLPNQPDPKLPDHNPVVARYAFWIEDETAKLNISQVGNTSGSPAGSFERDAASTNPTNLDLGALPLDSLTPLDYTQNLARVINADIISFRDANPSLMDDPRALNQASDSFPDIPEDIADSIKFHTTSHSSSNDLAMTGRRRANLNHIVTNIDWDSPPPNASDIIAADLDDIAFVITGQHMMASAHPNLNNSDDNGLFLNLDEEDGPMPTFGDRFFTGIASGYSTALKREIYMKKIASNIRDYIDTDSQPTFVNATGRIPTPARPSIAPSISEPKPQAIGKEAIPYLQEHAWRGYIVPDSWSQSGNTVTADLRFDHYFELFNPTTKDYTAPAGTFIKVYDLPTWQTGAFPQLIPNDFEVNISGITVPAGDVRVITTNNKGGHPPNMIGDNRKLIIRATNPLNAVLVKGAESNEKISSVRGFQLQGRSSSITDYRTSFLMGTNNGILDHFPALSISLLSNSQWNITDRGNNVGSLTRFVYSSSLRGNDRPSRTGDARSLSEQLTWKDYQQKGNDDQSHFYGNIQGHADSASPNIPDTSTFGFAGIEFVKPANWPDYHIDLTNSAASALAVVRDSSMLSVGELGHIYDPHRKITTEPGADIRHARGGGRSLRVGQRDDLIPGNRFATTGATVSWFNAAWRLCDLFSADDPGVPVSPSSTTGRLNINGALRDNGVAIRAALREFVFLDPPEGDPARAGRRMSDTEIGNLLDDLLDYLEKNGPMIERGELSQLPFFAGAGNDNRAGGQDGSTTIDRGREEIFRRVVELITTRSFSFSIHCLGEAVRQLPDGEIQTEARSAFRQIIQLVPQVGIDTTNPDGSPVTESVGLDDPRVPLEAAPDSMAIRIVHESRLF